MKSPTFVHRLEYWGARGSIFVLSLLPERLGYPLIGWFGAMFATLSRRRSQIGLSNLRQAFADQYDDRELRRILRRATGNAFKNMLDLVWGIRLQSRGRQLERFDLRELQDSGVTVPFIGCTGHLGSWEVAGVMVGTEFGECHAIGRVPKNPLTAEFLRQYRERSGLIVHPRRGGIRPVARALARGQVALQVIDQNQRLRGVFVPFFGRIASTERGAATLAVRRGYPVVVGVACRLDGRYRFRIEVAAVLQAEPTGDLERDVAEMARRVNEALEELVRRHPEQYLWIHNRYRTRPPDEAGVETSSTEPLRRSS